MMQVSGSDGDVSGDVRDNSGGDRESGGASGSSSSGSDSGDRRIDTYVGTTQDGFTIASNFEVYTLAPGGRFIGRLYFAGTGFTEIIYQPSALAYSEELLVTWKVPSLNTVAQPQ
jgi:hypothetical protein